jgi:bacteriorhodopsin
MRKRRPIWMWLAFALLLGALIALVLVLFISD